MDSNFRSWMPVWVVPVLIAFAIGTVWLRLSVIRTTYSIDQVDHQLRELDHARDQMQLKVAALRSPRRLELLARTRFGLSQPKSDQIIHMSGARRTVQ